MSYAATPPAVRWPSAVVLLALLLLLRKLPPLLLLLVAAAAHRSRGALGRCRAAVARRRPAVRSIARVMERDFVSALSGCGWPSRQGEVDFDRTTSACALSWHTDKMLKLIHQCVYEL